MVLSNGSTRKRRLTIAATGAVLIALAVFGLGAMPALAGTTTAVTPQSPTHVVVCGPNNDTVTTPGTMYNNDPQVTVTTEFVYVIDPYGTDAHTPGTITVAALPNAGYTVSQPGNGDAYVIEQSGHALWTFTDANTACPPPVDHVTATAPTYTPGTCSAVGTVVATDTAQYTWATSGTTAATYETATAVGNVVLDGTTVFGPYDLSMLSGQACVTAPPTCDVTAPNPLTASWVHQYVDVVWTHNTGHFTATLKNNVKLCGSVTILVSGYKVPDTWNGNGFNPTAVPQQLVGTTKQIVLTNDIRTGEATADLPTCGNAQADGYTPPELVVVTTAGHGNQYIAGNLWHISDCAIPPVTCVVDTSTAWAAESGDNAPVLGPNGLEFKGASVPAIDWYQRVTAGNAQGITHLSVTYAAGGTGQPAQVVVEVLAPYFVTGSNPFGFATLSTNLTAPSGTIDLLGSGVGWSSTRIASGPGSLGSPESYSDLVNQIGANTLFSAPSLHLKTHSTANDISVVSSLSSSCGSTSFVPEKPANVVTTNPVTTTSCKTNTATTITTTTSKPYIWDSGSKSYVLDTDPADWTVTTDTPGVTVQLTNADIATKCPDNVLTPAGPAYNESCTISASNTVDAVTKGVVYADVLVGNTVTTTATTALPFIFKDGAQTVWTHTFVGAAAAACVTTQALAFTGMTGLPSWIAQNAWIIAFWTLMVMLLGIAMIVWMYIRRRRSE